MSILLEEERDGIAILTLNRPDVRNAVSTELGLELEAACRRIGKRKDIRVVIVRGAGGQAFCAGIDLKERRNLSAERKWEQSSSLRRANEVIRSMPQAVIAAIEGWCLGGGFELAINCDIKIAAEDSAFAWPEMQLGVYPGGTVGVVFPRLIGRSRAKELFFTARRIDAREAFDLGIIEQVVAKEELLDKALEMAEQIKVNSSPLGLAAIKQMVNVGADMSVGDATVLNDALRRPLESTKDYEEGIRAFFEKRKPVWRGE